MAMASRASQRPHPLEKIPRLPARGGSTRIRRFNGLTRRTADWDGLRRDSQLWFDDGDCLVHFHGYGTSKRGPSLRISFKDVEKLENSYLLHECLRVRKNGHKAVETDERIDSGYGSILPTIEEAQEARYELYIPSPHDANREQAFAFHVATRNFFAYAVGRPVVGERLSSALMDLWQRLRIWAPKTVLMSEFTAYLETQGYLSFAENPEHALACLKFAENARIRDIWTDAFVHCAGMHERLFLSPEYPGLSNSTNALITRASLEMDLHIARVIRAVSVFLEEQLGPEHLGLTKPARDHLDYFRSFLHSFYVDKLGYFPPPTTTRWDKRPWKAMYHDFQALYDYIVDADSTCDLTSAKALTGGICVIQNVQAFDQRHGYDPLPHPLPLLPQQPVKQQRRTSQMGLRSLSLGVGTGAIPERKFTSSQSLAMATNCLDEDVVQCHLVQEYQRFERQKLLTKLEVSEARKTRWILIYGVLQMLTSIMRAPKEVGNADKVSYPLCVLTGDCPPWPEIDEPLGDSLVPENGTTPTLVPDAMDALEGRTSRISIHPDCEADNAEDFFASMASGSSMDTNQYSSNASGPLRLSTQLARTASIRTSMHSSVQALHRSVVGSLTKRNSLRRESLRHEPRKTPSYCEILVEDYGNGSGSLDQIWHQEAVIQPEMHMPTHADNPLHQFDFGLGGATGEPVLESQQLHSHAEAYDSDFTVVTSDESDFSPRGSYHSSASGELSGSNRSSLRYSTSPDTDLSSWEGGNYETESDSSAPPTPIDSHHRWYPSASPKQLRYRPSDIRTRMKPVSVNVGCYVPSGMMVRPVSKSKHRRSQSGQSTTSYASSLYPDESIQAADIEEVDYRGRRRSRAYERDPTAYMV